MSNPTPEELVAYNIKRQDHDRRFVVDVRSPCNAPFNNMYFTTEGRVGPCWLNLLPDSEFWSPNRSIKDIWFGDTFNKYRTALKQGNFIDQCKVCSKNIKNNIWPLAMAFDPFSVKEYPTMLELELSNQCNLECVMCEGRLSSGIRKNRDKLPALPMVYDDSFVEQLKEFIPHLEELRFNGGEPFAQKIVYDICMEVAKLNPLLKITMATNGTVLNKQVRQILQECNIHLNISIDSLDRDNYGKIRVNGVFNDLMENFIEFRDYCHNNNRVLSVMINPMRDNWWEMPDFLEFCDKHKVHLWFNTIHHPANLALHNLERNELSVIYATLNSRLQDFPEEDPMGNRKKLNHFVNNQVKVWFENSREKKVIPIITV
jgi:molybdenum cofactor biosynthesis enzyme MoaA